MPIYEFGQTGINRLETTTFKIVGTRERPDLQRLLRDNVEVIAPETLIISEEFGEWEDSRRRIDLLGIDKAANLVVIELKRTEDGGLMDLQSIRYASMVSTMTFDKAADVYGRHLKQLGKENLDPHEAILDFLDWDASDQDHFAPDVRIVLASAEFSREVTTSVLWLIDHNIDIRCVRLKPYSLEGRLLVDVQQIIPLPEANDYQVQVREKVRKEREARTSSADFTRYDVQFEDERQPSMWKRNALHLICKRLCERGIDPDELAQVIPFRRLWYTVEGTVESPEFEALAFQKASEGGPGLNRSKWFCDEGELIHANGKTYALAKSWGKRWRTAMDLLKDKYGQFKIEFDAVEKSE